MNLFKYLTIVIILIFGLTSCNDENEFIPKESVYTADNISDFVKLGDNDIPSEPSTTKSNDSGAVNIVIFRVEVARPRRNCLRGFGFCKFEWFPDFKKKSTQSDEFVNPKKLILKSGNQANYVEILVSEEIPSDIPSELLDLVVEESMTTEVNGQDFTLPAGNYSYNPSLGEFGGYQIQLN